MCVRCPPSLSLRPLSLLTEAVDRPRHWALKVGSDLGLVFAVEAIAASFARALAQEDIYWHGRVFLPLLHAVGTGSVVNGSSKEGKHCTNMLVMELAHGTLDDHQAFNGDGLIMVAWALASTLALLNHAGFLHGDLKPSNVLWREFDRSMAEREFADLSGWPLLSDFGSAQCFHSMLLEAGPIKSDDKIEAHGWTQAYAAPEVKECNGKWQTMRSDMYSYAKTLVEINQYAQFPESLQRVVNACLQDDPQKRPASFAVIASVLEENSPCCLKWGRQLWERQQTSFSSPALAHKQSTAMQEQGLQVLVAQRTNRLRQLTEGRKTKQVINPYLALARQHEYLGSPTQASELCRKVLVLDPYWVVDPAFLTNLGNAEGDLGNAARMKELLERALKTREAFFGQSDAETAFILGSLGNAEGYLGNASRQKKFLERALKIEKDLYGQDHPSVARTLGNLGNAEGQLGNTAKKKELLDRALKILEGLHGQDHPGVAKVLANLGNAEGFLGNAARMKRLLERALKINQAFYGQNHPEAAKTLTNLGNAEGVLGNATRRKELAEHSLKILEGCYLEDHPNIAIALGCLANAEGSLGNAGRMKELLERALKIKEGFYGQSHPEVAKALMNLGNAEGDLGNAARMKGLLERALKIQEGFLGQDHPEVANTLGNLGVAGRRLGQCNEEEEAS